MSLTQNQLLHLRGDLQLLAKIDYDDVLDELLDHYATLTEQHLTNGMSFDDASKWAWSELGSGAGLQVIQDDYVRNIQEQVQMQHLAIVKDYFRWPTFLVTALVAALAYITVPLLPANAVIISIWGLVLLPAVLMVWASRKVANQPTYSRSIVFQYMQRGGGLYVNLAQVGLNFSGGIFGYSERQTYLQTHTSVSIVICLFVLLYTISFVQLYRYQFHYKVA